MIDCIDNGGFEDLLTEGRVYAVVTQGVNGYEIETDKGDLRWFGASKFEVLL